MRFRIRLSLARNRRRFSTNDRLKPLAFIFQVKGLWPVAKSSVLRMRRLISEYFHRMGRAFAE
jgi:hypothetical protein